MTGESDGFKPSDYININGLLAGVVRSGAATLHELKTVYSLEDARWLEECFYIPKLNEMRWQERQKRHAEAKRMIK